LKEILKILEIENNRIQKNLRLLKIKHITLLLTIFKKSFKRISLSIVCHEFRINRFKQNLGGV